MQILFDKMRLKNENDNTFDIGCANEVFEPIFPGKHEEISILYKKSIML